jgi:hypothetical protein
MSIRDQHPPQSKEDEGKSRCLLKGETCGQWKAVLCRQLDVLRIGAFQPLPEDAHPDAHEISAGQAEFAGAASRGGVEANGIADFDIPGLLTGLNHHSGSISS